MIADGDPFDRRAEIRAAVPGEPVERARLGDVRYEVRERQVERSIVPEDLPTEALQGRVVGRFFPRDLGAERVASAACRSVSSSAERASR